MKKKLLLLKIFSFFFCPRSGVKPQPFLFFTPATTRRSPLFLAPRKSAQLHSP
jgi:hypothetical protein